jgi:hypothetical protein
MKLISPGWKSGQHRKLHQSKIKPIEKPARERIVKPTIHRHRQGQHTRMNKGA